MEEAENEFLCPVCFEVPPEEIYQCKNGHWICANCARPLRSCPHCRERYGTSQIRVRVLEGILDKRTFSCYNKDQGCKEKLLRNQLKAHSKSCKFRRLEIPICKNLGYRCDFFVSSGDISGAVKHFEIAHASKTVRGSAGKLTLENFSEAKLKKTFYWAPNFLEFEQNSTRIYFMIVAKINGKDQTFSLTAIQLDGLSVSEKDSPHFYRVLIDLHDGTFTNIPLEWTTPVAVLNNLPDVVNTPTIRVPLALLKSRYVSNGALNIHVNVDTTIMNVVSAHSCPVEIITVSERVHQVPRSGQSDFRGMEEHGRTSYYHSNNIICSSCHQVKTASQIMNFCLQCVRFILCGKCKAESAHSHNLFVPFKSAQRLIELLKREYDVASDCFKPLLSSDVVSTLPDNPPKCPGCRYMDQNIAACLQCKPFYSVCARCYKINNVRDECKGHAFFVLNDETR